MQWEQDEMPTRSQERARRLRDCVIVLIVAALVALGVTEFLARWIEPSNPNTVTETSISSVRYTNEFSWTDTSPSTDLSERQFRRMVCLVYWFSVVLCGLGTEIIVGRYLIERMTCEHVELMWTYAQFIFPVTVTMAFQGSAQQSPYCLIPLIAGLWKLGFPETFGCIAQALSGDNRFKRLSNLCNGIGGMIHHSSSALLICSLMTGLVPNTRQITACVLPLLAQHMFVLLKYHNVAVYGLIELALEIDFEWEMASNIEHFYGAHGATPTTAAPYKNYDLLIPRAGIAMVIAHWLYWLGAFLGFLADSCETLCCSKGKQSLGTTMEALRSVILSSAHENRSSVIKLGTAWGPKDAGDYLFRMMLMTTWRLFDADGDGCLTQHEIQRVLTAHGSRITDEQIRTVMSLVDIDENGTLDFEEFTQLVGHATLRTCADSDGVVNGQTANHIARMDASPSSGHSSNEFASSEQLNRKTSVQEWKIGLGLDQQVVGIHQDDREVIDVEENQ